MAQAQNKNEFTEKWYKYVNNLNKLQPSLHKRVREIDRLDIAINELLDIVKIAADNSYSDNPGHLKDNPEHKNISVKDKVIINPDALKRDAREYHAQAGYTQQHREWRNDIRKLIEDKSEGVVERIFPSGSSNVKFEDIVLGIDTIDLIKVNNNNNPKHNPISLEKIEKIYSFIDKKFPEGDDLKKQDQRDFAADEILEKFNIDTDLSYLVLYYYTNSNTSQQAYNYMKEENPKHNPNNKPKPRKIQSKKNNPEHKETTYKHLIGKEITYGSPGYPMKGKITNIKKVPKGIYEIDMMLLIDGKEEEGHFTELDHSQIDELSNTGEIFYLENGGHTEIQLI